MTTAELVSQLDAINEQYKAETEDDYSKKQYWFELWQERLRSGKDGFALWRFDTHGNRRFYGGFQPGKEEEAIDALRIMNRMVELYKLSGDKWED